MGQFETLSVGQMINIQAYKHDGTLYRQWNGVKVIDHASRVLICLMLKTKVMEASGQKWVVREPMIWFFDKVQWYNTTALIKPGGVFYYTNLASPPVFEDKTLKFIDYDLDLKAYPGKRLRLVDRQEYATNSAKYHYTSKIKATISQTVEQVTRLINAELGFFNPKLIARYLEMLVLTKQLSPAYTSELT